MAVVRNLRGCIFVLIVFGLTLGACGDDDDDAGSAGDDSTDEADDEGDESGLRIDGSWSGTTSEGGAIRFTVSDGVITSFYIEGTLGGADCPVVSETNELPETEIPVEDDRFSVGGPGEGIPVEGDFDSETTASGSAEFAPSPADASLCEPISATWEADRSSE